MGDSPIKLVWKNTEFGKVDVGCFCFVEKFVLYQGYLLINGHIKNIIVFNLKDKRISEHGIVHKIILKWLSTVYYFIGNQTMCV